MSKYCYEFKLEVVKYYLEKHVGYQITAEHFNLPHRSIVQKWVRKYQEHGSQGLIRNFQKYDGKFKENVVEYMHNNHLSLLETCIKFNLGNQDRVGKWERIYYEEGPQGLYIEKRGRSKIMNSKSRKKNLSKEVQEDLIAENQRLRMENAYLKKLQALVQERVNQENQKKHKPSKN